MRPVKIDCSHRMQTLISELRDTGIRGLELDVQPECHEEWSIDYAICLVSVIEPEDDHREFFDLDRATDTIVKVAQEQFGDSFKVIHGSSKRVVVPRGQFIQVHRLGAGWELEIEAYRFDDRIRSAKKVKTAAKAAAKAAVRAKER